MGVSPPKKSCWILSPEKGVRYKYGYITPINQPLWMCTRHPLQTHTHTDMLTLNISVIYECDQRHVKPN